MRLLVTYIDFTLKYKIDDDSIFVVNCILSWKEVTCVYTKLIFFSLFLDTSMT